MAAAKKRAGAKSRKAVQAVAACSLPMVPDRILSAGLDPNRLQLIRTNEKKWANGTVLHYYFFDRPSDGLGGTWRGPPAQQQVVHDAFAKWKNLGIGLEFREVANREEAEIRIGFQQNGESWSYVGRDVVDIAKDPDERTMNFGWDLTTPYGRDTALHEIGHTLGFPHEHQNPYSGIVWDEPAVYAAFRGQPNYWSDDKTKWNVLRKLSPAEVGGSQWDPNSIMHYWFRAGLIREPARYFRQGLTPKPNLSAKDKKWAKKFYPALGKKAPPELRPFESKRIQIAPGGQVNFTIKPRMSREYTIQTFGRSDTVIALFEHHNNDLRFVAGDDDSGSERNARIRTRLFRDSEYVLRVRLYYSDRDGEAAVFLW
jgi:hypothetical protein